MKRKACTQHEALRAQEIPYLYNLAQDIYVNICVYFVSAQIMGWMDLCLLLCMRVYGDAVECKEHK